MLPSQNVFWKELLSFFRDRRTLFSQVLLPLFLMPLFMFLPSLLMDRYASEAAEETYQVAVAQVPPELVAALEAAGFSVVEAPDPAEAVREGRADVGIAGEGRRFSVYLALAQGGMKAEVLRAKVARVFEQYKEAEVVRRLKEAGLDPAVLRPFEVSYTDVSPPEAQSAGALGFMLPMMLLMFVMAGAMPVVLDATAGEKERGTLEVLLAAPVPRSAILLGKAGAALVAALLATLSGVGGLYLGGLMLARQADDAWLRELSFSLGAKALLATFVTAAFFAALAVGLMIFLGLWARTYREAQTYVSFLYMALVLPAVLFGMVSSFIEPTPLYYLIPVAGPMVLLDAVFRAKADMLAYLLAWGSTLFYAALALGLAAWAFTREEIVFKN